MNAPISAAERARTETNIATIKRDLPEFVPFFKALHAQGMVDGWRDITYVGPARPDPHPERIVSAADMVDLRENERIKEKLSRGRRQ